VLLASWPRAILEIAQAGDAVSGSDAASERLTWVIWGLLALAVVIAVATVVFWWFTRPERDGGSRGVRWIGRRGEADQAERPPGAAGDATAPPSERERSDRAQ